MELLPELFNPVRTVSFRISALNEANALKLSKTSSVITEHTLCNNVSLVKAQTDAAPVTG